MTINALKVETCGDTYIIRRGVGLWGWSMRMAVYIVANEEISSIDAG